MKCGIIILVNSFKEKTLNTAYPSPFVIFPTPKETQTQKIFEYYLIKLNPEYEVL